MAMIYHSNTTEAKPTVLLKQYIIGRKNNNKTDFKKLVVYGCKLKDMKLLLTHLVDSIRVLLCNLFYVHSTHRTANNNRTTASAIHQECKVRLALNVQRFSHHHLPCSQHIHRYDYRQKQVSRTIIH